MDIQAKKPKTYIKQKPHRLAQPWSVTDMSKNLWNSKAGKNIKNW